MRRAPRTRNADDGGSYRGSGSQSMPFSQSGTPLQGKQTLDHLRWDRRQIQLFYQGGRAMFVGRIKQRMEVMGLTERVNLRLQGGNGLKSPPDGVNNIPNVNCPSHHRRKSTRDRGKIETAEILGPSVGESSARSPHIKMTMRV